MKDWTPRCKSCGAEILWIKMASGKSMPVDAKPISYRTMHPGTKGFNVMTLVTKDGRVAKGVFDPSSDKIGYTSHFATCPNANAHRKR